MRFLDEPPSEELTQQVWDPISKAYTTVPGTYDPAKDPFTRYRGFVPTGETVKRVAESTPVDIAASMAMPMFKGLAQTGKALPFLARMAAQGGLAGTESALQGAGPADVGTQALLGGLGQGAAETLIGGIGRPIASAVRGGKIARAWEETLRKAEAQAGGEASRYESLKSIFEGGEASKAASYAQALKSHAERGAATIADSLKSTVPALADIPSTTEGLVSMIYGEGRSLVQKQYARYLQSIKTAAQDQGLTVSLSLDDLRALGIKPQPVTTGLHPDMEKFMRQKLGLRPGEAIPGVSKTPSETGEAPAATVIERITGKSANRELYRRVTSALADLGLGDPVEREAYRTYEGYRQFIDKTKALKGRTFHPEKIDEGLLEIKKAKELTQRSLGHADVGPFREAAAGVPTAPVPGTAPATPLERAPLPEESPELLRRLKLPSPFAVWAAGYGMAGPAAGHAAMIGGEIARLARPQGFAFAPNRQAVDELLTRLPAGLAALVRAWLQP